MLLRRKRLASADGIMAAGAGLTSLRERKGILMRDGEPLAHTLLRKAYEHRARFDEGGVLFMSDPVVARELGFDHPDAEGLVAARHYLEDHDYVERVDIGVAYGTFVVTEGGKAWMGDPPNT